jgi:hypothetical protein
MHRILLACGVAAGPFFVAVVLVEGWLRQGYQPLRQPISALAMGPRGWIQRANFFVTGGLALACVLGLPTAAAAFIALFALGLIGSGIYITDITGLDSRKLTSKPRTRDGIIHDLFALPVCVGLLRACGVMGRLFYRANDSVWAWYSATSGGLFLGFFVLASVGFAGQQQLARVGGLLQRLAVIIGWTWLSLSIAHIFAAT